MNLSQSFHNNLNDRAKQTLVTLLRDGVKASVDDLRQVVGEHPSLRSMTLDELFDGQPWVSAPAAKSVKLPPIADFNLRTSAGRDALDAAVLQGLKDNGGKNVASSDLNVGVDAGQRLVSLNRLIEAGKVTFTGKARSTRYSLA